MKLVTAGLAAVAVGATLPAPKLSAPKLQPGWTVQQVTWPTVSGAAVYQIFLDGKAAGIQIPSSPATSPRQGYALPVTCGVRHKVNARAGDASAKNGSPSGWGPFGTPQYWTPAC